MLISVIIPVYNAEKYLDKCINSLLVQDFKDYEIILVNDGSTDNSTDICDKYSKKYEFISVIHKKNEGAAATRNVGINSANGEYVVFLDSDDYIKTNTFFSELYKKTINNPDLILYKFCKYYENTGKIEKCTFNFKEIENSSSTAEKVEALSAKDAFYCSAWLKAVRRELLIDNNIIFQRGIMAEDIDWYYRVLTYVGSIELIDKTFVVYRQRENSITSSGGEQNFKDNLFVLEDVFEYIKKSDIDNDLKEALISSGGKMYSNLLINYSRGGEWKSKYKKRTKELSYLLNNTKNPRAVKIAKIYKLFGFDTTILCLKILDKLKHGVKK